MMLFCMIAVLSSNSIEAQASENVQARAQKECIKPWQAQLKGDLRKLWIDHMIWTRNYIVSAVAELEDQEQVLARLLKNQQDIGNSMKPYYGEEAGNKLGELLIEHIMIAGKIVDAAKGGNQAELEEFNKQWVRNSDDIAQFLSSINPNWTEKELKKLLYRHLQLIADELTARIGKDWNAEIAAYDMGEAHIVMFADVLAEGIIKQFPKPLK
ncbi:glycosyltransferase [Paenibacillus crassostreae]|uniref:Glycosyltransferase n=1 Tax=Paenibacillus crassostreae TaxID=1763538 RepID=A0A167BI84_9BACL|nr:glycosyltransferase [Paenibacillus crassostreae]AOZ94698.1 glycosyltransferase [Paenibacillus crassostreae]OAB72090.1 glycosyltransferase [Paenibacillus crassostreae]